MQEGGAKPVPFSTRMLRRKEGKASLMLCYKNIVVARVGVGGVGGG